MLALNSSKSFLHNCLTTEVVHWKQKFKIRWLQDGDKNTKFFHFFAKSRSSINRIDIISVDGNVIEDAEEIRVQACSFFSNLMQSSSSVPDKALFNRLGPSVSDEQNQILVAVPTSVEIREVVFSLKRSSSPGPDGFSGVFFTHCWGILVKMSSRQCLTFSIQADFSEPLIPSSSPLSLKDILLLLPQISDLSISSISPIRLFLKS